MCLDFDIPTYLKSFKIIITTITIIIITIIKLILLASQKLLLKQIYIYIILKFN